MCSNTKRPIASAILKVVGWLFPCFCFCLKPATAIAQIYNHEVYVIGNFADVSDPPALGKALAKTLRGLPHDWTVLLNGDLMEPEENFMHGAEHLHELLDPILALDTGRVVILPGDRDWDGGSRRGLQELLLLEEYIKKSFANKRIEFAPSDGCPGPELVELSPTLNLIALNTQWWNQIYGRPTPETAVCDVADEAAVLEEIESLIEESANANVLIAGHHAHVSHGRYGGYFPLSEWVFPIPGISFFATAFRQNVGGKLHLANPRLSNFAKKMRALLAPYFSVVYVGGHDRTLEATRQGENLIVNSGNAGEKRKSVTRPKNTVLSSDHAGIGSIYYGFTGIVQVRDYGIEADSLRRRQQAVAFQAPCFFPKFGIPVNRRLLPCAEFEEATVTGLDFPDSIRIAANPNYGISPKKQKLLGAHYRKSWTAPVNTPVLNLQTFAGGLFPIEEGGGRQTKSLKFAGNDGLEYVFRSVDKDPSKALNYDLRSTIISLIVRDQTTTQQPYGALVIPPLLDRIGILHAEPKLFVMPNSEELGPFRSGFGGMLGMMEDRPVDPRNGRSFADAEDVKRTINLFRAMFRDKATTIETDEFVRARVFDLLVGDWGKHEDNWKWAGYQKGSKMVFRPIPRDRDHVFALYDGFLPRVIDREWAKPSGEHFGNSIKGLRSLMWQARHLDRFAAAEADRSTWMAAARNIQTALTPESIDEAVKKMPEEIVKIDGEAISSKLKHRIQDLPKYADKYYRMIAKEADVVGSNKVDYFYVDRKEDGTVEVSIYTKSGQQPDDLVYQRLFLPQETKEIRLFGMGEADRIDVNGDVKSSILLRVIPGSGLDTLLDRSSVASARKHTLLYQDKGSVDRVISNGEVKYITNASEESYRYQRTAFAYNTYFPLAYLKFSSDYGLALNTGVNFTNHSYGKPGFSSKHSLDAEVSTIGNLEFRYDGTWRHVVGRLDLIAGLQLQSKRRYRHFFGIGNETELIRDRLDADYYTAQFGSGKTYLGLEKTLFERSYINLSLRYELFGDQALKGTIFDEEIYTNLLGTQEQGILSLGGEFDLDLRNRKDLPERGARFYSRTKLAKPLEEETESYLVGQLSLEYFMTAHPLTIGIRGGVDYSRGEVPYYDLPTLGQNANLRGYRRNRYSGQRASWINSEMRIQLRDRTTSLIPYKFGLRGFVDLGKVYARGEVSDKLHVGYGVGVYFVPLRERFSINVSVAFSEEDSGLVIFSLGSAF
ncbi:MAG: BamA/TamA family outer membrane protein [Saprospiraceae bacterium]|nr:BamA/TamA family outer membrane protein [Saprospiraceae bacterium]